MGNLRGLAVERVASSGGVEDDGAMAGPARERGARAASAPSGPASGLELIVVGVGVTAIQWIYLAAHAPLLQTLPGWFWPYAPIALHHTWIVPALAVAVFAVWRLCARGAASTTVRLAAIVALCFGIQVGVSWLEGRGAAALADPILLSGHGDFARAAVREPSLLEVARRYESRLAADPEMVWGDYARSKPPGYLLFYMATQRLSVLVAAPSTEQAARARFSAFASIAWALLSCLSVLPLYAFARLFLAPRSAELACLLWGVVPAFQLITGHLDQVLLPSLALCCLAVVGAAARRASVSLAAGGGALCVLANFVSFSLLPVWPLALAVAVACLWHPALRPAPRRLAGLVAAFAAGVVVTQSALALWLDYDVLDRLQRSLALHARGKQYDPSPHYRVYASLLDLLELGYWWGAPLMLAWGASFSDALTRALTRRLGEVDVFVLGMLVVLLGLLVFGRTLAEVARLWLFLAPLACVAVSEQITRRFASRPYEVALGMLILQLGTLLLLKQTCDLYPVKA
jgi:hypothetical protein